MDTLYTFWENITHQKAKRVHFLGLMNSANGLRSHTIGTLMEVHCTPCTLPGQGTKRERRSWLRALLGGSWVVISRVIRSLSGSFEGSIGFRV